MYVNQKLRVRWKSTHSSYFNVSNGVKQGGVISTILFCIYIDGLLLELEKSGVGCFIVLVVALHILTNICIEYAAKYYILFNGKKVC